MGGRIPIVGRGEPRTAIWWRKVRHLCRRESRLVPTHGKNVKGIGLITRSEGLDTGDG